MDTVLKKRMLLLLYDNPGGFSRLELLELLKVNDEHLQEALRPLIMTPFINYSFNVDGNGVVIYQLSQFGRVYVDKRRPVMVDVENIDNL